jgi:hypothetical protein
MSNFTRLRLEQALSPRALSEFNSLRLAVPSIDSTLSVGGWLCGGFARHLLLGGSIEEYLAPMREKGQALHAGDVDLFFPSVDAANKATNSTLARPSQAGFAKEMHESWRRQRVKVQLVDHPDLVQPTIEDTLSHFDLVNCQVGIDGEHIYFPDDWEEVESQRLIRIAHNNTPFLGSRVLKYLEQRGLAGLTEDSYEKLHGWFAHAGNDFAEGGWNAQHISGIKGHVKRLRDRGLMRREDLIFFLNKWKVVSHEKQYGMSFTYEVDWALNELGKSAA